MKDLERFQKRVLAYYKRNCISDRRPSKKKLQELELLIERLIRLEYPFMTAKPKDHTVFIDDGPEHGYVGRSIGLLRKMGDGSKGYSATAVCLNRHFIRHNLEAIFIILHEIGHRKQGPSRGHPRELFEFMAEAAEKVLGISKLKALLIAQSLQNYPELDAALRIELAYNGIKRGI